MNPDQTSDSAVTGIRRFDDSAWRFDAQRASTSHAEAWIEDGEVLCFPALAFELSAAEKRFLDPRCADPRAKNISLRGAPGELRGACSSAEDQAALRAMLMRFRDLSGALVDRLFPHYRHHVQLANTSYRPVAVEGRASSWRKDDSRLHVDAFPSNPMQGQRLLRVFSNLNPHGVPRSWRVGQPFEAFARDKLATLRREWPGSAWTLHRLGLTKRPRTPYDHVMLQLHDAAKADAAWQRDAPQAAVDFAPGTTWVVYSDQVLHAAMGGQFMMEQTLVLDPEHQLDPAKSPLHVLERLSGRTLRPR